MRSLSFAVAGIGALGVSAALLAPRSGLTGFSIREQARETVIACAEKVEEGTTVDVDRPWKALCRKDLYQEETARYTLRKEGAGVRVITDVFLDTLSPRADVLLARTRECLPLINLYWNRYSVQMDFRFELKDPRDPERANTVRVIDQAGRSSSRNFYFLGLDTEQALPDGRSFKSGPAQACEGQCEAFGRWFGLTRAACREICEPVRQKEYCQMLVHELGHLVGLPDEYADPGCPDREFVSNESYPWSIMAVPFAGLLDQPGTDTGVAEFFPRHLETVVGPLCGGS